MIRLFSIRRGLRQAAALARRVVAAVYRDFIRADLRQGAVDISGLEPEARWPARGGLLLLFVVIGVLLGADAWRARSELIVLSTSGSPRGQSAPVGLLSFTLFTFVASWAFALTAGLRAHPAAAFVTLGVYELNAAGWMNLPAVDDGTGGATFRLAAASLVGIPVLYAWRRRRPPRPAFEFAALFALTACLFLAVRRYEAEQDRRFGLSSALHKIDFNITYLRGLVTPLLLYIGLDIAEFTCRAARWTTDRAASLLPPAALPAAAGCLWAYRGYVAVAEFRDADAALRIGGLIGGAIEFGLVVAAYVLILRFGRGRRPPTEDETADEAKRTAVRLVLAFSVPVLTVFLMLAAALALPTRPPFEAVQTLLLEGVRVLPPFATRNWHLALGAAAIVAGLRRVRRGRGAAAPYLVVFGLLLIYDVLTGANGPLRAWQVRDAWAVEAWWLPLIGVGYVRLARRASGTARAAEALLFALLVLTLMRQRDFIENPFTPLFGFAGAAFVAFGLLWDIATQGAWTNVDTPGFPRLTRTYFYLGFILLTASVLTWAVATHDLDGVQRLTGGAALAGFDRFGKPLSYVLLLSALRPLRDDEPPPPSPGA